MMHQKYWAVSNTALTISGCVLLASMILFSTPRREVATIAVALLKWPISGIVRLTNSPPAQRVRVGTSELRAYPEDVRRSVVAGLKDGVSAVTGGSVASALDSYVDFIRPVLGIGPASDTPRRPNPLFSNQQTLLPPGVAPGPSASDPSNPVPSAALPGELAPGERAALGLRNQTPRIDRAPRVVDPPKSYDPFTYNYGVTDGTLTPTGAGPGRRRRKEERLK